MVDLPVANSLQFNAERKEDWKVTAKVTDVGIQRGMVMADANCVAIRWDFHYPRVADGGRAQCLFQCG